MKICTPSYYNDFVCIASNCKDCCCRFWQVELDCHAKKEYSKIIKEKGELGISLKKAIKGNTFKNVNNSCFF